MTLKITDDIIKYLGDRYQIHVLYGDGDTILLDSAKLTPKIIDEIREKFNFEIERESLSVPRERRGYCANIADYRTNSEFIKKRANDLYGFFFHNYGHNKNT